MSDNDTLAKAERIFDDLTDLVRDQKYKIDQLEAENEASQLFIGATVGWREYDWPEGFCRRTAELIAENSKRVGRGE